MKNFIGETFISEELCDKLIKLHDDVPWKSDEIKPGIKEDVTTFPIHKIYGRSGDGNYNPHIKDSVDVGIHPICIHQPKIINQIYWPYLETIQQYFLELEKAIYVYLSDMGSNQFKGDNFNTFARTTGLTEPLQIQRYEPNAGFHAWHWERFGSTMNRELVFMTYLNDVPDGGTHFYHQKKLVKAEKGKTLIWPASFTHIHRGQISKKHVKYIITGWINWHDQHQQNQPRD